MESTFDSCFQLAVTQNQIDNDLYRLYNVKKGLRNEDGTGVRIGLTRIADVVGYEYKDGMKVPWSMAIKMIAAVRLPPAE